MNALVIETTGPIASVAFSDGCDIKERTNDARYSHLEELVPMIEALLREEEVDAHCVDAVAVSRGPGSFTGIRIGMMTAKALAQVWDKPLVLVPTLEAFAYHEAHEAGVLVVPVLDARRGQIYAGAYRKAAEGEVLELIEEGVFDVQDFLKQLTDVQQENECVTFCGDGVAAYETELSAYGKPFRRAEGDEAVQRAAAVARLAQNLYAAGRTTHPYEAEPEYMRISEAERKRRERCRK